MVIPTRGFARGAVVHRAGSSRNMLVVRGLGRNDRLHRSQVRSDAAKGVRLRDFPTAQITAWVLPSGT